jgi:hypothetical protein
MSWAERSTGISPTITNSCPCTCSAGSTASTPISPDIDEQIEARLAPFMWIDIAISATEASGGVERRQHAAQVPQAGRTGGTARLRSRVRTGPIKLSREQDSCRFHL